MKTTEENIKERLRKQPSGDLQSRKNNRAAYQLQISNVKFQINF